MNNDVLDLIGGRPSPPLNNTVEDLSILGERALLHSGRSSLSSGGDLRSLRGEAFANFWGDLGNPGKDLESHWEDLRSPGGRALLPSGYVGSLRGIPWLSSGGGFCSPGRSVEAGMPHSCRMIRPRSHRMLSGDRIGVLVLGSKELQRLCIRMRFPPTSPSRSVAVSYTHLTLPTKRIV